jgi:hypothetical protein
MSKQAAPKIYERDVLSAVREYLTLRGITHWRCNTGAYSDNGRFIRYGKTGSSDFIGVCPDGRFLAVECKRPGGRLSEAQRIFLDEINASGGVGIAVDSVGSLEKRLKEQGVV